MNSASGVRQDPVVSVCLHPVLPGRLHPGLPDGFGSPSPGRMRASFTVEASLLMTVMLPVLLAIFYYGFFLHDKGVLNGAAQQITAQADLNNWKESGNNRLPKQAKHLEKQTGPTKNVSCNVSVSREQASVHYSGTLPLPGLIRILFGKSSLSTGGAAKRTLLYPADVIRKIRGLEYVSSLLKGDS